MQFIEKSSYFAILAAFSLLLFPGRTNATERHFAYTYETGILNPGDIELEPWQTYRYGRERFYSRFDQRLEFEVGLLPNLQTSLYWNMSAVAEDVEVGTPPATTVERQRSFDFEGISSEWKYKLSDPLADALGSALYFEARLAPAEAELEAKVILDKRLDDLLLAFNLVGAHEWIYETKGESEREIELEADIGFSYFVSEKFTAGLELRVPTVFERGKEWGSTAFFIGPTVAYAEKGWWTAVAIQPQIAAIKNEEEEEAGAEASDSRLDLHEHERFEVRWLMGFHL